MKYSKEVTLKNNNKCTIKNAEINMAQDIINYKITVYGETDNIFRYPHEMTDTVEEVETQISKLLDKDNEILLCAYVDDNLVATAGLSTVLPFEKVKHRATYGIAVVKDYWNVGIGYELTKSIIEICKSSNYKQLELEVVSTNKGAVHLYEKLGFKKIGTNDRGFLLKDGQYLALDLMVLEL